MSNWFWALIPIAMGALVHLVFPDGPLSGSVAALMLLLGSGALFVLAWPILALAPEGQRVRLASLIVMRSCPSGSGLRAARRLANDLDLDPEAAMSEDPARRAAELEKLVGLWALMWQAHHARRRRFLRAPLLVPPGWRFTAIEELFGDVAGAAVPGSAMAYATLVHKAHHVFAQREAAMRDVPLRHHRTATVPSDPVAAG